jgi:hypothetical protein
VNKKALEMVCNLIDIMEDQEKVKPTYGTHLLLLRFWLSRNIYDGCAATLKDMQAAQHPMPLHLMREAYTAAQRVRIQFKHAPGM